MSDEKSRKIAITSQKVALGAATVSMVAGAGLIRDGLQENGKSNERLEEVAILEPAARLDGAVHTLAAIDDEKTRLQTNIEGKHKEEIVGAGLFAAALGGAYVSTGLARLKKRRDKAHPDVPQL